MNNKGDLNKPINPDAHRSGEASGDIDRNTSRKRGNMTIRAEREAREKMIIEELAKIEEENKRLREMLAQNGITLDQKSSQPIDASDTSTDNAKNTEPAGTKAKLTDQEPTDSPDVSPTSDESHDTAADEGTDVDTESGTDAEPESEPITPERVSAIANQAKKHKGLKRFIAGASALALAAIIGITASLPGRNKNANQNNTPNTNTTTEYDLEDDDLDEAALKNLEIVEAERGIQDNYDKKGMWLSKNKPSEHAFASASEVADIFDGDEQAMMKYAAHNQVETFADYIANLPERLQPEGFKGLSIIDAEKKLESLSDDDYESLKQQFDGIIDQASVKKKTINGHYQNAYMRLKDANGKVTHDNMELVRCETNEDNLEITELSWTDENGNLLGTMMVKITYDKDGKIGGCMQVINESAVTKAYVGLTTIQNEITNTSRDPQPSIDVENGHDDPTPTPGKTTPPPTIKTPPETPDPTPTPETPPETPPNLTPKNEEAEKKNDGERASERDLNEQETPQTTIQEDQANFEKIEQQKRDDATQAEADRQAAAAQAEAERQAAAEADAKAKAEAEAKAQAAAEADAKAKAEAEAKAQAAAEAADKAQAEAEAAQRAAAEAERQRAAEQADREQAQREADERAAAERAAAEAASTNDEARDAADFANGAFDLNS